MYSAYQPAKPKQPYPPGDFPVQQPPSDGISALEWSPVAMQLIAASWDTSLRIWDAQRGMAPGQTRSAPKAMINLGGPVLSAAWSAVLLSQHAHLHAKTRAGRLARLRRGVRQDGSGVGLGQQSADANRSP